MVNRRNAQVEGSETATATSVRPKRVPIGNRPKIAVYGKDPAFEYRVVNDTPGRIAMFKYNGWQLCTNDEVDTGNFRADEATEIGSLAYYIVDSGNGMKGYVMKISKEEYKEIQDALEAEAAANEETLAPNLNDGEYGKITIDRSGRR